MGACLSSTSRLWRRRNTLVSHNSSPKDSFSPSSSFSKKSQCFATVNAAYAEFETSEIEPGPELLTPSVCGSNSGDHKPKPLRFSSSIEASDRDCKSDSECLKTKQSIKRAINRVESRAGSVGDEEISIGLGNSGRIDISNLSDGCLTLVEWFRIESFVSSRCSEEGDSLWRSLVNGLSGDSEASVDSRRVKNGILFQQKDSIKMGEECTNSCKSGSGDSCQIHHKVLVDHSTNTSPFLMQSKVQKQGCTDDKSCMPIPMPDLMQHKDESASLVSESVSDSDQSKSQAKNAICRRVFAEEIPPIRLLRKRVTSYDPQLYAAAARLKQKTPLCSPSSHKKAEGCGSSPHASSRKMAMARPPESKKGSLSFHHTVHSLPDRSDPTPDVKI